jgi:CubicO group peptidase (beta-lactamase class C family)
MILAPPSDYPILTAEQELQLCSVGPPTPATPHGPGEWLRRMGRLPLMDQPGRQWRYNTSSLILGALVARTAGQPMDRFYRERIFGPLGMTDTGFTVPAGQLARLVPCYQQAGGKLVPFDDGGQWAGRSRSPTVGPAWSARPVTTWRSGRCCWPVAGTKAGRSWPPNWWPR